MNRFLTFILLFVACLPDITAQTIETPADTVVACVIFQIDSLDNYYVITAASDAGKYFIVSRKMKGEYACKNIIAGESYLLTIQEGNPSSDGHFQLGLSGCFYEDKTHWNGVVVKAKELCGLHYCEVPDSQCAQANHFEESLECAITNLWIHSSSKKYEGYVTFRESVLSNMSSKSLAPFSTTIYSSPNKSRHIIPHSVVYENRKHFSSIIPVKCYILSSKKQYYYVLLETKDCISYGWIPKRIYKSLL